MDIIILNHLEEESLLQFLRITDDILNSYAFTSTNGNLEFFGKKVFERDRGSFVNGLENGFWVSFYSRNGQLASENYYVDGVRNGLSIEWWGNGQKLAEGYYDHDKKNGLWTDWQPNGQKAYEGTYEQNKKVGVWKEWSTNGKVKETIFV